MRRARGIRKRCGSGLKNGGAGHMPKVTISIGGYCDTADHALIDGSQVGRLRKPRLCRSHPFEQIPVRHKEAAKSPQNRIGHQPCLVGQKCEHQGNLACTETQVAERAANMAPQGNAAAARY